MAIEQYNIKICIPSRNIWTAEFGLSLSHLIGRCLVELQAPTAGFKIFPYPMMASGSVIAELRNRLVKQALADEQTTHILFLDDDQMFPAETLHMLLAYDKPIIGANIVRKEPNPRTNARALDSNQCVWTTRDKTGIEEVDFVGTGLLLVRRDVFEAFAENKPFVYDVEGGVGEDVYFCRKARELGFPVYIEHDLSKLVKHVGSFYWGHEHTKAWQDGINNNA